MYTCYIPQLQTACSWVTYIRTSLELDVQHVLCRVVVSTIQILSGYLTHPSTGMWRNTVQAPSLKAGIMNIDVEVSQARTELLFLEEKARGLLKQFFDVRAAIATQHTKIDHLVRRKPTAINNLPIELLISIFRDVDSKASWHLGSRKCMLASVCRHWRDVINNPVFWTTIYLPSNPFSTTTHLERSCESHIDIVVHPNGLWLRLASHLDMVLSHAYRWRSLVIDTIAFYDEPSPLISKVLEKMNNFSQTCRDPKRPFTVEHYTSKVHFFQPGPQLLSI